MIPEVSLFSFVFPSQCSGTYCQPSSQAKARERSERKTGILLELKRDDRSMILHLCVRVLDPARLVACDLPLACALFVPACCQQLEVSSEANLGLIT